MWPHSSHSQPESLRQLELVWGAAWAGAPYLVVALALSQLKSLQEEGSLDSSASAEEAEDLQVFWADHGVDVAARPLPIQTSGSLSQSPTPSQRKLPRTSSSNESGQARDGLGHFRSNSV